MFAKRMKGIEVTGIRKMFELAGEGAINLGLGEPDFQPARHIKEALEKALADGFNKYGPTAGIYQLREAVAERLKKYKSDITHDEIIITAGATEALHAAMLTFIEKGDEVLVPNPGFPLYPTEVSLAGGKPVFYRLKEDFMPNVANFKVSKKTKAIIVNSPSNPTGSVFSKEKVKEIIEFAEDNDLIIFSDEVYDEIIYDCEHFSFLGNYDNVVHINSFSKTYALTGWRLGYLAAKKEFVNEILKMHYYTVACPPTPTQYAALTALKSSQECVKKMVSEFRKRRDTAIKIINDMKGFRCLPPKGAFYLFPSYNLDITSEKLALKILEKNVICVPGIAFGTAGESHLRISYANSIENIEKGLGIVREVVEKL
ncbi:MAG: pyridoxal phosphate-dependent aminotransferase [Candidatus Thermoplasmatota archaeon]|nr:pyridoxal phosphate-dependent aminotransferase [Candidatus Thermoplasmatota archaeon]